MRLAPRSIQGRMLLLSAIATLVALAIAGVAIGGVLARFVTEGIDRRLDAELALAASAVTRDGRVDRARLTRLSGALDAGPRWRWRIATPSESIGSDDIAAASPLGPPGPPPPAPPDPDRAHPFEARDRSGAAMHARQLTIATSGGPVVVTAAAPRNVIQRPVRVALVPLLATLALLGAILAAAAVAQIRLGLRPLRRLRDALGRVRSGEIEAVDPDQPAELQPLVAELNALVGDNQAALATARASAANLAHALKTPVATLMLEVRDDPVQTQQVARIDATIRHHLARARARTVTTRAATRLDTAIAELVATVARLRGERGIAVDTAIPPGLAVAADAADLDELAGNLIDNAVRHARSKVMIDARPEGRLVRLIVTDDGPGIPAADRRRATAAGVRLDKRSDGHGFGLAIARELAELHGGALVLDEAPGGGLAASVTLPVAAGAAS